MDQLFLKADAKPFIPRRSASPCPNGAGNDGQVEAASPQATPEASEATEPDYTIASPYWQAIMRPAPLRPTLPAHLDLGAHLLAGFSGTTPNTPSFRAVKQEAMMGHLGGVVLYRHNIAGPEQFHQLCRNIATWRVPSSRTPFLIVLGEERDNQPMFNPEFGFAVHCSPRSSTQLPASLAAKRLARMACERRAMGIHVAFGPLLDRPSATRVGRANDDFAHRFLGDEISKFAGLGCAHVEIFRQFGLACVAQHFPGLFTPLANLGRERLGAEAHEQAADVRRGENIFAALIASCSADAIMSSHASHPAIDASGTPLTFSRPALRQRLRDELSFRGALFTEDFCRDGMLERFGAGEAAALALGSSHDFLVFGASDRGRQENAHTQLVELSRLHDCIASSVRRHLAKGELTMAELEASKRRVDTFRDMVGAMQAATDAPPALSSKARDGRPPLCRTRSAIGGASSGWPRQGDVPAHRLAWPINGHR